MFFSYAQTQAVTKQIIMGVSGQYQGFKKCCVSNDMNGADDDVLWEEDHEENSSSSDENVDSD
jgi:hypothetical protein